ncbi:MAG: recombinase family protein [bacterium]|nr:recombinase family protein [bacterium]
MFQIFFLGIRSSLLVIFNFFISNSLSIFAALAEFERDLISERTKAGLAAARARGRKGGRKCALTKAQVMLLQASVGKPETNIQELANELGVSRATIYRYVSPEGELREPAKKILNI